jgi:phosphoglycolate phosphatase-like HAD superfamily hydrolase
LTEPRAFLLWDVDHTLIENGGASKAAYSATFRMLIGREPEAKPDTHGRTDFEIMANLIAANGEDPASFNDEEVHRVLVEAMNLQRDLLARSGYALAGAQHLLEQVQARPDVVQSVLTGNVPENALTKLAQFDLAKYMDLEIGGYGTDGRQRFELVDAARVKARQRYGYAFTRETTVLVGDTLRDVDAARHGGASIIAVATGVHSQRQLRDAGANVVIADLTDPDLFFAEFDRLVSTGLTRPA